MIYFKKKSHFSSSFLLILIASLMMTTISCTKRFIEPLVLFSKSSPPVSDYDKGSTLYTNNCSSCHGPLTSSTKLGKSSSAISFAITTNTTMASPYLGLIKLTPEEINLIAFALNTKPTDFVNPTPTPTPTVTPEANPNSGVDTLLVVSNRYLLSSQMKEFFVSSGTLDASDTQIINFINTIITNNAEGFGGNCTRNDPGCVPNPCAGSPACKGALTISQNAQVTPVVSSIRKGYQIQACEKVLSVDKAVNTVTSKAGVSSAVAPNATSVNQLINYIYRGKTVDTVSTDNLLTIASTLKTKGASLLEQWRFITLAVCQAAPMDLL